MEITRYINGRVIVKVGDITDEQTDAIVNAANWTLLGGGGVDGAIHDRGGSEIYAACQQIREDRYPDGLPTGEAVVTTGGDLHPKYVIHTVGPIYGQNNGRDAQLLFDSYTNALRRANELGLRSVAFPSISTGAFYFPKQKAAKVVSIALQKFLAGHELPTHVFLVFFDKSDAEMFIKHQQFTP